MHKLQYFSKYNLLDPYNSSGFSYLQGRFNQIAPPHKPYFEHHCSNHTFHKCVLNNGMHIFQNIGSQFFYKL